MNTVKNLNSKVYLVGAIEGVPDGGWKWRNEITPLLVQAGFDVINPLIDVDSKIAKWAQWDSFSIEKLKRLKLEYSDLYKEVSRKLVMEDLKIMQLCEHALVYFDQYAIRSAGTYGEMTLARFWDKNVVVIRVDGIDIPIWAEGCITSVCSDYEEAIKSLKVS